jgi:hypothetical protein
VLFCSSKEMVSKLKRTPTEWEKIFANYTIFLEDEVRSLTDWFKREAMAFIDLVIIHRGIIL